MRFTPRFDVIAAVALLAIALAGMTLSPCDALAASDAPSHGRAAWSYCG
jgi:hypothetical protein